MNLASSDENTENKAVSKPCFIALALSMDRNEERREMLSATPGPILMLISFPETNL